MRKLSDLPLRSDVDGASGAADGSEKKRKQVSKRVLMTGGAEAESMDDADGANYILLDSAGNHDFPYRFGDDEAFDRKCAIFGYLTKIGNVANTVLNDKEEPGSASDAAQEIREWIAGKVWAARSEGGGGTRIDKDALAAAYVEWAAEQGVEKDIAKVREALEDSPQTVRKLRADPAIRAKYDARVGKAPATPQSLLDAI